MRARLRYEFDKTMAGGTGALIAWLGIVSLVIISLAAGLVALLRVAPEGAEPLSFMESFWASLMRTLDPGTMGGDEGWAFRIMMLGVTLAGIFIVSALIGVLSAGLEGKLEQLRKGRSLVLERDHTIIFNWSPSIFDIISELVVANESRKRPRIVIMSDRDKIAMEDEIDSKVSDLKNSRIICRSGDPTDLYDIAIVNPQAAQSVIILSPDNEDDPDSRVIKTILALVNDPDRREARYRIAAEIRNEANAEIARVVGGAEVQLVRADDLISRIMVQSTRQPGLSAVYTELLDFDGCEIYAVEQPELTGKTFAEALVSYDVCSLIGVCTSDGAVKLDPPMDLRFEAGMKAILIAEDDDEIEMADPPLDLRPLEISAGTEGSTEPERTLLLGWNRRAPIIALELSRYANPGSILTIAADIPDLEQEVAAIRLVGDNLKMELRRVDTGRRNEVEGLDPASYDHVLVLGYSDHMESQAADTRTLITLLHLRRVAGDASLAISVVSEMIDVRNRVLAEVTRVDDFVVSNKLVSLMLAQASENEYLERIFQELLSNEGAEICLRPAHDYVPLGKSVTFYDVVSTAGRRGEVAIGHHRPALASMTDRNMGGIVVNPTKSEAVVYGEADRIIVISRD